MCSDILRQNFHRIRQGTCPAATVEVVMSAEIQRSKVPSEMPEPGVAATQLAPRFRNPNRAFVGGIDMSMERRSLERDVYS